MQVNATRWSHARFLQMANGLKPSAHREPIKADQRQVEERADPALQELEGAKEGLFFLRVRTFDSGWVLDAPMRDGWVSWPDRTGFTCRAVADGEHKIHHRGFRSRELVPAFRAIPDCRIAMVAQHLQGQRVDCAFRLAA